MVDNRSAAEPTKSAGPPVEVVGRWWVGWVLARRTYCGPAEVDCFPTQLSQVRIFSSPQAVRCAAALLIWTVSIPWWAIYFTDHLSLIALGIHFYPTRHTQRYLSLIPRGQHR